MVLSNDLTLKERILICIIQLNEQVPYRWVVGSKKTATTINYCQNGCVAKAKVTLVFWTQALSHSL